jgi:hypothetical protein
VGAFGGEAEDGLDRGWQEVVASGERTVRRLGHGFESRVGNMGGVMSY